MNIETSNINQTKDVKISTSQKVNNQESSVKFADELNKDKKHVDLIIEGLKKKDGYCPCRVQKIPENICCCTHFINDGDCCCKLWLKAEKED